MSSQHPNEPANFNLSTNTYNNTFISTAFNVTFNPTLTASSATYHITNTASSSSFRGVIIKSVNTPSKCPNFNSTSSLSCISPWYNSNVTTNCNLYDYCYFSECAEGSTCVMNMSSQLNYTCICPIEASGIYCNISEFCNIDKLMSRSIYSIDFSNSTQFSSSPRSLNWTSTSGSHSGVISTIGNAASYINLATDVNPPIPEFGTNTTIAIWANQINYSGSYPPIFDCATNGDWYSNNIILTRYSTSSQLQARFSLAGYTAYSNTNVATLSLNQWRLFTLSITDFYLTLAVDSIVVLSTPIGFKVRKVARPFCTLGQFNTIHLQSRLNCRSDLARAD